MSGVSLSRYLVEKQRTNAVITHDLRLLIENVASACKAIAALDLALELRMVLPSKGARL